MFSSTSSKKSSRGGAIATAAAVLFVVSGLTLIGVALASQTYAPQLPRSVVPNDAVPGAKLPQVKPSMNPSPTIFGETLVRSKPVALDIPSIGVHSEIQYLGQTADGALETPAPGPLYDTAAWYRYSPTPGSLGPAILLGHVDSAAGGPSVFFRLGEVQVGARVSVTRADGSIAVFVVDEVHQYAKDHFPTDLVYNDIDHAGLRIVTCGGAFDDATGHYLDNIVVFASLVSK